MIINNRIILKHNIVIFTFNKNCTLRRFFFNNPFKKILYVFIKPKLDFIGTHQRLNKYLIEENHIEIYYKREFLNEAFLVNEKLTWDKKVLQVWDEVWHIQTDMDFILDIHNIGILSSIILTPVGENMLMGVLSVGTGLYIGSLILNCIKIAVKVFYESRGYKF